MRCPIPSFRTLLILVPISLPLSASSQTAATPPLTASPDGKTLIFPGDFLPNNTVHFYFASQNATSSGATDGIATLLASPVCTTSGCTVIADPLDSAADKFPNAMPDRTHFLDYRNGRMASWTQNPEGAAELHWYSVTDIPGDKGFPKSGNAIHGTYQFNAIANNAAGWAYGLGGDPVTNGEYLSDIFRQTMEIHAAGITNVFATSGTISKPDDVNYDNNYLSINPAAYGASSEGVTFHRDYLPFAPPFFGVILSGGPGTRTMTLKCTGGCSDMSLYTPLIDVTSDVLSGNIQFDTSAPLGRGFVETLSTDFAVPVSLYGPGYYIPAQTNIEGLVFSATTSGSDAAVVTVAFDSKTGSPESNAVSVTGNAISVAIKKVDGKMRTLGEIAALFDGGVVRAPAAGSIAVFPSAGIDTKLSSTAATAKALAEVAAPRQPGGVPIVTTLAVGTATPLVAGQMMDLMGPQFNEVTAPSSVGKLVAGLQAITAPLYFSHPPGPFCANTGTAPGSGMVGRYIELTNVTKLTIAGKQRYVQTILCSPTAKTLLMGTIGYGSFKVLGNDTLPQPATIFHGADLRRIFDPAEANKTQEVNGPGYGTYAAVDANDTFNVGDTVENTPYIIQNWTKNKTFMDVEDPFATWHGHIERYVGAGLNGAWTALLNLNERALYKDRGGSLRGPDLMRISGVWGGGFTWDELPALGSLQPVPDPYLLYVQNWASTTQKRLGVFRAGFGSILYNQGGSTSDSFFGFGDPAIPNGIRAGSGSFEAVTSEALKVASSDKQQTSLELFNRSYPGSQFNLEHEGRNGAFPHNGLLFHDVTKGVYPWWFSSGPGAGVWALSGGVYGWSSNAVNPQGDGVGGLDTGMYRSSRGVICASASPAVAAKVCDGAFAAAQFVPEGAVPSIAVGAAAGKASTVRVTGTNMAGVITLKTGTGSSASGTVAAVSFHGTLGVAPQGCSLMPREPNAAAVATTIYTTAPDTSAWSVNVGKSALTDGTTYVWSYICM
jgi:hypothetical protein